MCTIMLGLYNNFECIADKCPSTCCSGWKITVDDISYSNFENISDTLLRDDIISNIVNIDGEYRFINRTDGRCAMLDNDGLCRIQKNLDEKLLCNTCRKFPRLISKHDGFIWLSMAASCPVVADYIIDGISFYMIDNNGSILRVNIQDIPFISNEILNSQVDIRNFLKREKDSFEFINLYKKFVYIADIIADIIIENHEITYLDGSLDYFENDAKIEEILSNMEAFDRLMSCKSKIFYNYVGYRIYTRYLEYPNESIYDRKCYVFGEVSIIYTISFSFFMKSSMDINRDVMCSILNWVYRLFAHNAKTSNKFKAYLKSIADMFWN